jgi:hypothetical protein
MNISLNADLTPFTSLDAYERQVRDNLARAIERLD